MKNFALGAEEIQALKKILPSNSGRKRLNIQGAINLDTHNLISTVRETLNKQSTIDILKKIELRHLNEKKIYVIVDNAGYYKAEAVKQYLKKSKIKLVYLPVVNPNASTLELAA